MIISIMPSRAQSPAPIGLFFFLPTSTDPGFFWRSHLRGIFHRAMKNPGTGPGLFLANCKAYNIGIVQGFRWHDAINFFDVLAQLKRFDQSFSVVHKQLRITSVELFFGHKLHFCFSMCSSPMGIGGLNYLSSIPRIEKK